MNRHCGRWEISSVHEADHTLTLIGHRSLLGDGWELRNRAIESGVIEPLVDFVRKDVPVAFLRNITWVMVNLSRHKEPAVPSAAVQEMLPALKHLLTNSDTTVETMLGPTD